MTVTCPNCAKTIDTQAANATGQVVCPRCNMRLAFQPEPEVTAETVALASAPPEAVSEQVDFSKAPQPNLPEIPGYEMLEVLGRGGMGVVLKARHHALNRLVAIKMPLSDVMGDESFLKRFFLEARTAASLQHLNICPVYDVGQHEDRPYIAMAFIPGVTLRDWAKTQKPTPRQAAEIVAKVSRAVGYAHQHNLIHRDIKPANVMIASDNGEPILMDFGLAKEVTAEGTHLTHSGDLVGTPAYMAPEQAAGHLDQITPRTDIYALGIMLYELLCGAPPFVGSSGDIFVKIQTEEPSSPRSRVPQLHRDLETICLKAIAKEPAKRYASAVALAEDLERFCAGEAILARRESWVEKVARKARRNRMAAAALAGVLVLATVAGFVAMHARASSRIAALTTQLQQRLESPSWSAEELADAERIADELSRLERKTTQEHRRRVVDRLADTIRQSMHRPNLSETDHRQIEASIALLKPRDATRAAQLRQELDQRLRQWTPIYSLKPPFENLQTLPVQPGTNASEGLSFSRQRVELPVTITGNARLEAEFVSLQKAGKGVGFAIQGEKGKRYEFRLTPAPPPRTNAAPNRIELDLNASDLTERLKGWYADTPNTASVIMEEGRPIIRLENRTHSSKTVSLAKWFDPAFHQGKEWEASFRYRISNFQIPTGANTNNWNVGMRIFIEGKRSNGSYSSALLRFFKNCDWTPATIRFRIPRDVPRIKFAFEIRSAIGRLEVSDLKLTERNADGSADSPSKLLLAQPQQEWHPETNPAHAWMVSGDTRNMMVMEDNGKRFLRLTSDGTADRTSVTGHFHVDPQTVETATLTARARVNQFESLSQTNASLYIILTAKDSLGRSLNTKTWGFNSPCDWHAKSFEISIPPDACFLAIGVSAWSCRASIDIGGLACNLKLRPVVSEGSSQPMLTILRDNKVLRERPVPSNIITVDPVRLAAECIGGALRLQVGDEPPIEANDPFPLSIKDTRPTFIVGGDVRLRSLAVCRHSMPAKPNPLEIGDELFTAGRFHEAQSAYENQTRKSSDPDTQQQAHYKIAMCLLQQKRPKEAESEFALVAKSNSLTWSSLAACQLWTIYLDQRRNEEADAVFLSLRSKRDFAQILRSLTPDIQEAINKGYSNRARAMLEYGGPADWQMAVERLPQLLEVADALNMHPFKDKHSLAMRLAESYAALGQTDRALDVMRAQFDQLEKEDQAAAAGYRSICHNSCDFYRRLWAIKGQPKEALAVLERWDQRIPHTLFAVTTARCLLAMNRLPEAEKKLTDVVANTTSLENEDACGSLVAANLLLGLIAEKRQGPEAARQVWAEAFCRLRQAVPNGNPVDRINESSRSEFFQFMLLASLSGELKDSDMPTLRKRLGDLGQVQTGEDASKKTVLAGFTVSVTRQSLVETFSSERGAVYARKVIRGDLSRNEERHTTFALLMEQFFIQDSIGRNNLTTEVESIYWKFAQQFLEAFRTDQLSSEQCMSFAIAWKGITNIFGWESLQSDLTPALRGPMAFVMGHRYIKLGKKEDAISFFHTAKNDAAQIPDGNALVKAADDAMKKLSAK